MLRGIRSITAIVASACVLTGCSGGDAADPTASTTQAATATVSPVCRHGGTTTVTLQSFDAPSLTLTGVDARGNFVVGRFTAATAEVAADLRAFPPDPIFPQCTDDATLYDDVLGSGLTRALLASLGSQASHACHATLVFSPAGSLVSFQPVP